MEEEKILINSKQEKRTSAVYRYLKKWRTDNTCTIVVPNIQNIVWSFIAGFLGILLLSYLAFEAYLLPLFAPFGASAVLLYGACHAPFSQPRNLIGGHLLAALTGVLLRKNAILSTGFNKSFNGRLLMTRFLSKIQESK
ncbi:MAG: HPP family protein [Clostridia bacterium]|jgi:CBS-domain-containing membrane protein|nr:HPP family protein [Clostridia bacterium]